jgi:hypothetical protein
VATLDPAVVEGYEDQESLAPLWNVNPTPFVGDERAAEQVQDRWCLLGFSGDEPVHEI